ncbi:Dual specificity mitogen-activated protein kinase kinase 2 [Diatrype stigma]|uniref:Dual specificity mitogen-activated protein kinase kinase 2 n=1 Tax=Diatrype stigma TaxID=117547 RepID=A0AAN9YQT1_9PEZI
MVEVVQELLAVVWHNGEYFTWRDREDSEDVQFGGRPHVEAVPTDGDMCMGLWIKMDEDHHFGPAGEHEHDFNYVLPAFVDSEVLIKKENKMLRFRSKGVCQSKYWQFGFDGQRTTQKKPLAAHAWQLGCATFMAVLTNQSNRQLEAMVTLLHKFFRAQYREGLARTVGIPGCLSRIVPLQLAGAHGTYIVPRVPQAVLGRGHFGEVYKGVDNQTNVVYAVKIPAQREGTAKFESYFEQVVQREKRNMRLVELVCHKHIIQFQDLCANGRILVLEHIPCGSSDGLYRGLPWPTHNLFRLGLQISSALEYLHTQFALAHRDVQPGNILVRQLVPLHVVLADFGHAALRRDPPVFGNMYYRAPETWQDTDYHCQSDLWSLGATVLNLAIQPRFKFDVGKKEHHRYPELVLEQFVAAVAQLTPTMRIFIGGMLRKDPASRFCAREVHTSAEWLAGYGERGYPQGYPRTFLEEHGVSAEEIERADERDRSGSPWPSQSERGIIL